MAEIYAAFLAYDDHNIGRVIEAVKKEGLADNTLIIFIEGDNGGSAEGTLQGTANEVGVIGNGADRDFRLPLLDQGRARRSAPLQPYAGAVVVGVRYAVPVDQTLCEPFRRHPQRHGHELAQAHQGRRDLARAVSLRDRHHADDSRGRRRGGAGHDQRRETVADRRNFDGLYLGRRQGADAPRDAIVRDVRQSRHLSQRLDGLDHAARVRLGTGTERRLRPRASIGSFTTSPRTSLRATISPRPCPKSSSRWRSFGGRKLAATMPCR